MTRRCLICHTTFQSLSWSGPSEPCDCGLEYAPEGDYDPARLAKLRAAWADPDPHVFEQLTMEDA